MVHDQSRYKLSAEPTVAKLIQSPVFTGDRALQLTVSVCPGVAVADDVDADAARATLTIPKTWSSARTNPIIRIPGRRRDSAEFTLVFAYSV